MPKLRFPGFEGEWENALFTDLFSFLGNNTLSRAELTDIGKVKNIHYGDVLIRFSDVINTNDSIIPYIKNEESLKKKTDYLQTGDVVIADTAEDDSVGKATEIFNPNNIPTVAGLHTIPCRPNFSFTPSYLGYYINSKTFHRQLYPYMQGIKVTSISKGNIGKTLISYPNLSEQCKIANLLNILSKRISKQQQLVEVLKLYKRGLSEAIFTKKMNLGSDANIQWEKHRLGSLGFFYNGLSGKSKDDFGSGNCEFISYMNIYKNLIVDTQALESVKVSASEKQNLVQYGDILFTQSSETLEEIGYSSVWLSTKTPYLNSFCFGFRFHTLNEIDPYFIAHYFRSSSIRNAIMREGQGATRVNLSSERLKDIVVSLPPLFIQKRIGAVMNDLQVQISHNSEINNRLCAYKNGLLQSLFI